MTIEIELWMIPTLITVVSILVAYLATPKPEPSRYVPDVTPLFKFGIYLIIALLVSLLSWIFYGVLSGLD